MEPRYPPNTTTSPSSCSSAALKLGCDEVLPETVSCAAAEAEAYGCLVIGSTGLDCLVAVPFEGGILEDRDQELRDEDRARMKSGVRKLGIFMLESAQESLIAFIREFTISETSSKRLSSPRLWTVDRVRRVARDSSDAVLLSSLARERASVRGGRAGPGLMGLLCSLGGMAGAVRSEEVPEKGDERASRFGAEGRFDMKDFCQLSYQDSGPDDARLRLEKMPSRSPDLPFPSFTNVFVSARHGEGSRTGVFGAAFAGALLPLGTRGGSSSVTGS